MNSKSVLLVFIAPCFTRFGQGIDDFIRSYTLFSAGFDHDVLVVYKSEHIGLLKTEEDLMAATGSTLLSTLPHSWVEHPNEGYDIGSFLQVSESEKGCQYEVLAFVGSTTIIQTHAWLRKLVAPFLIHKWQNIGAVGTCGSWQAGVYGEPFPNVHLRTGPIWAVRPETLNSLAFAPVLDKPSGYHFEHGTSSLTKRLHHKSLEILVAGSSGSYYTPQAWYHKNGFCDGDGSEMLATDRHARMCKQDVFARFQGFENGNVSREKIINYSERTQKTALSTSEDTQLPPKKADEPLLKA